MLSQYKKKRDADNKKAILKALGNNKETADTRNIQTAYLTAKDLEGKILVLTESSC
jgi:hypothetical protein